MGQLVFMGDCSLLSLSGLAKRACPAGLGRIKGRDERQVRQACTALLWHCSQTQLLDSFATSGQQKKIIVAFVNAGMPVIIADL